MPRPKTKVELLEAAEAEFTKLMDFINRAPDLETSKLRITKEWTTKDILGHIHEWHNMTTRWYEEGKDGNKPAIPAEGYTWKTVPDLNEKIYRLYKNVKYKDILAKLRKSHNKLIKIIESHTDEELFTKKLFPWTNTTSMGAYFISATSSHYKWANDLIKKAGKK